MARRQALDAGEHGPRTHQAGEREHLIEAGEIDATFDTRMGQNCLDLGSEYEVTTSGCVKQWSDSELVSCTEQAIARAVKQHESELTIYSAEKLIAQLLIEMDQDFNIGLRAKAVSLCNHFFSELAMIEDLTVANQKDGLILIRERLVAGK